MQIGNDIMKKAKKILRLWLDKTIAFLNQHDPELASKITYYRVFKKKLNLKNPIEFNEKLMWLKIYRYSNSALFRSCTDKYCVREYVQNCGLDFLLNDLIGVYNSTNKIDWDNLPNQFVLKCNHGAGYNIICNDFSRFDRQAAIKT